MRLVAAEAGRCQGWSLPRLVVRLVTVEAGCEAGRCRGWLLPRLVAAEAGREAGRC